MSYTIAYTDAENVFQADQVLENGVKLKGKSFDDSRDVNLVHVDSENVVQVGDSESPTHIQGKNIMINGKDLESEIEKLFLYGVDQKRKIVDSVNSLFDDAVVGEKNKWEDIVGILSRKEPYPNYSFFIAPQRHSFLSMSKMGSVGIFGVEKWINQSYIIVDNFLLLFGGQASVDGVTKRVDYVGEIDLRDFDTTYTPQAKPRKRDDFLMQDVHLVESQKSVYVIPRVFTDGNDRRVRQYVVNSDTWTTACLLLDLEVGDRVDGCISHEHLVIFSVNNGSRIVIFNTNTREVECSEVFPISPTPKVDEVIYTLGRIYCVSFEESMSNYDLVENIPCYDIKEKSWSVVNGNNLGGSIFRINENYYNYQQVKTSMNYKLPVVIYDYSQGVIRPARSHSSYHEYRNHIFFGVHYSEGGALALVRINGAYLFNSRVTIPISTSDGVIVNSPCNVYLDGTCPESSQGIYPNIKREFYSTGFIQIEPMDVTKYVFGGVIRP